MPADGRRRRAGAAPGGPCSRWRLSAARVAVGRMGSTGGRDDNGVVVSPLASSAPAITHVRGLPAVLAAVGVVTFLAGEALDLTHGDLGSAGWKAVGPLPFLAAGV